MASGKLDPHYRPKLNETRPVCKIGPFDSWADPSKIGTMDPWGHEITEVSPGKRGRVGGMFQVGDVLYISPFLQRRVD